MTRDLRWLLGAAVVVTLAPRTAHADGSGDQKAAAQILFDRAQALVEQNHFAEACPQFLESERLDPGIGTMLWLADCYENTGQTANAWTSFEQAAAMAASRHDARESIARDRAARLAARLSRLTIVVPPEVADIPGLEVHCDGVRIESLLWAHPISLNPGAHTITASAEDRQVWWTTVQLVAGAGETSVTVPELAALGAPTTHGTASNAPAVEASPHRLAPRGDAQRVAGGVLAAGGLVGLVAGAVFSLKAKALYDDSQQFCMPDNECAAMGKQDRSDADSKATVATVAMGLGAAGLVGGAVLYFTAPRAAPVSLAFSPAGRGGTVRANWAW